ncbi:TetR/AcrR family transcriptional regulator [Amycolatopsis sp. PS_44_ISF1]|uniref:TetR/AcrR family transcriptional regulator n=1 Tax=Amycolatopsis sp. PS_44_ISF1 TaxID=2974917 RepID=UPI0028DEC3C9|nr:TetR/AcrR family transcriptional regulator [Amycolatopsis sp. PS_44_ISF1]MDT8912626.1 TetR/AcrR family transcriptional regulator [Amycolatopsis sp. PS_44_ISF1]
MRVNLDTQAELGLSVTEATTRAQVIGATIATMAAHGYARTTFARIKERAGLSSTRIISYHFTSKAGLMQAVLSTVAETKAMFLRQRSAGLNAGDRPANLRAHIETSVAFLRDYPECVRVLAEFAANGSDADGWAMTPALLDGLRVGAVQRQLQQGQAEGAFGEFAPEVMAMSIAQSIDGAGAAYAADPSMDLDRYGRELADLFERATAPPGRRPGND